MSLTSHDLDMLSTKVKPKPDIHPGNYLAAKHFIYTRVKVGFKMQNTAVIYNHFVHIMWLVMQMNSSNDVAQYFLRDVQNHVTRSAQLCEKIEDITESHVESLLLFLVVCRVFSIAPPKRMEHVMLGMEETNFFKYLHHNFFKFQRVRNSFTEDNLCHNQLFEYVKKLQNVVQDWFTKQKLVADTEVEFTLATRPPTSWWRYWVLIQLFLCDLGRQYAILLMGMIRLSFERKYGILKSMCKLYDALGWFELKGCFRLRKQELKQNMIRRPFMSRNRQITHACVAILLYVLFSSFYNMPDTRMGIVKFSLIKSGSQGATHVWQRVHPFLKEKYLIVNGFFEKQVDAWNTARRERIDAKKDQKSEENKVHIQIEEKQLSPGNQTNWWSNLLNMSSWLLRTSEESAVLMDNATSNKSRLNVSINATVVGRNETSHLNSTNVSDVSEAGNSVSNNESVRMLNDTWFATNCKIVDIKVQQYLHDKSKMQPYYISDECKRSQVQCDSIEFVHVFNVTNISITCQRIFAIINQEWTMEKKCDDYLMYPECLNYLLEKQLIRFYFDDSYNHTYHALRKVIVPKNLSALLLQ